METVLAPSLILYIFRPFGDVVSQEYWTSLKFMLFIANRTEVSSVGSFAVVTSGFVERLASFLVGFV